MIKKITTLVAAALCCALLAACSKTDAGAEYAAGLTGQQQKEVTRKAKSVSKDKLAEELFTALDLEKANAETLFYAYSLVKAGADVNAYKKFPVLEAEMTPLGYLIVQRMNFETSDNNRDLGLVKILVENGADINAQVKGAGLPVGNITMAEMFLLMFDGVLAEFAEDEPGAKAAIDFHRSAVQIMKGEPVESAASGAFADAAKESYEKAVEKSRMAEGASIIKALGHSAQRHMLVTNKWPDGLDVLDIEPPGKKISGTEWDTNSFILKMQKGANSFSVTAERKAGGKDSYSLVYNADSGGMGCFNTGDKDFCSDFQP